MGHLNFIKLQKIKEDFKKQDEGLSMHQFIKVMLNHLPETRDRVGLVKNLVELFRQIDVNNDESLEWDEFTGHIIELGKCFCVLFVSNLFVLYRDGEEGQDFH
jgi:Ca2+-binding EF-hand superfamily protein